GGAVLVKAVEGGALGGTEGLAAAGTAQAPLLGGVDLDVTAAGLAPGRAGGVGTECLGGVHGVPPFRSRLASLPVRMFPGPPFDYPFSTFHGSRGCYRLRVGPGENLDLEARAVGVRQHLLEGPVGEDRDAGRGPVGAPEHHPLEPVVVGGVALQLVVAVGHEAVELVDAGGRGPRGEELEVRLLAAGAEGGLRRL